MSKRSRIDRREFIQRTALSATAAMSLEPDDALALNRSNASDRITVGMMGVGARAQELLEATRSLPDVEIVGVCDAYKGRVERAIERTGDRAKNYEDYREIIADPTIDAVLIGTPDHWHAPMILESLRAGKHVYVEKPMTYGVAEGNEIIREARVTGRIVQVGSQGVSSRIQQKAREFITTGRLGKVTMIRASFNRNTASGAWIYPIPSDASLESVNWDMFLGPAPKRAVDYDRFFRWRCYQDYSGGIATDLFVHLVTGIHFMMNARMPSRVMAMGQLYRWKDSRDVPDTINAILEYPEGFVVNLSSTFNNQSSSNSGFQIMGTLGTLILGDSLAFYPEVVSEDNRWIVESWPSELEAAYYRDPDVLREELPETREPEVVAEAEHYREVGLGATVAHLRNFFASVRTGKQPWEDSVVGHRAASCAHLINASVRARTMVSWDFRREAMVA